MSLYKRFDGALSSAASGLMRVVQRSRKGVRVYLKDQGTYQVGLKTKQLKIHVFTFRIKLLSNRWMMWGVFGAEDEAVHVQQDVLKSLGNDHSKPGDKRMRPSAVKHQQDLS